MAADFSRVRLNALLDYAGVELKQGAVLLDADANELVGILNRRLRALASDTLGRATVSSTTPNAFAVTPGPAGPEIDKGRLYVDGLLAENHGAASTLAAERAFDSLLDESNYTGKIAYAHQPYLPDAPALPASGRHLVYLDVWERHLTHLEQPDLVESALAVETSSRIQTVWQVRVLADAAGSATTCGTPDDEVPGWVALTAPSTGVLSTDTYDVAPTGDPCELPPTGGYRGLENQLYRVEIQDPGQPGAGATFKWSRENASVGSRVASMVSGTVLELATLGRDEVLRINSGDWVEIIDDNREFAQACGELRKVTVDEANRRISFAPALPAAMLPPSFPDSAFPKARNMRARRWEQKDLVFRTDPSGTPVKFQDLNAPGSTGVINVPAAGTALLLENGVTVSFDSTGTTGFRAGDYWVFAARTSDASVEILDRAAPRGIHHHYARLAIWDVDAGSMSDCRNPWPPQVAGGDCCCTACVSPESHASGALTIQAAVDKVHDTGGTVCLGPGQYVLAEPVRISGARSLRIHGQGRATTVVARTSAFVIESSEAITLDEMSVATLGGSAAISVRSALQLALRRLLVTLDEAGKGAAISLAGLVFDAHIEHNLLLAPVGVRALDPPEEGGPQALLTDVLDIDENLFLCSVSAVSLDGPVGHFAGTRIAGNHIFGTHQVAISATGVGLAGASIRISGNGLDGHGAGILCAVDGAWIEDNQLRASADGAQPPTGGGIVLFPGLDPAGTDKANVQANHISGFPGGGVVIGAPVQDLVVNANLISECGLGIWMADSAAASSLSIEGNQLRDIGTDEAALACGIFIVNTESASVTGNTLHRIGAATTTTQAAQFICGITAITVSRARVSGNQMTELGPLNDMAGIVAGIGIFGPYNQADVMHNHVERDPQLVTAPSDTAWFALLITDPDTDSTRISRAGPATIVRLDAARMLVIHGSTAYIHAAAAGRKRATTPHQQQLEGDSACVIGNVFIARGRTPAVDVAASGDVLFNDNRCELRTHTSTVVHLNAPVAVINGNRLRGGDVSVIVDGKGLVAAIGNVTTGSIVAPLKPEMQALNLIG